MSLKSRRLLPFATYLALALLIQGTWCVWAVNANDLIAQDLDRDGDVDAADLDLFQACHGGADYDHDGSPTCAYADTDQDGDVDQSDFGTLQACFSGPGVEGDLACGGCAMPLDNLPIGVADEAVLPGNTSDVIVYDSQVGALYQLRLDADNTPVGHPIPGNGSMVLLPTGPVSEPTTFNVLATNELWGCSVELAATQTVNIRDRSKVGVHIVIGARDGFGPFLENCANAGKPVALVKCVDDYGPAWEAKNYSFETVTIGRQDRSDDGYNLGNLSFLMNDHTPAQAAQWMYSRVRHHWQQNPWIDIWEVCNEWDSDYTYQADFYIAMMDLAESDGFRLALWSSSVGTPGEEHYPEILRTCIRAKASGNHILALHEYAFFTVLLQDAPTSMVTRYRRLYAYLAAHDAVIPLALTEVGQEFGFEFVGTELFIQDFAWYDSEMLKDPYVIGCAAWTLGDWMNGGPNFQEALPALSNYIINN